MPYRPVRLVVEGASPKTFHVRIPDSAIVEWLVERERLRSCGYPDRPPDIDTPTIRAWLPRPGEEQLRYFRDLASRGFDQRTGFPVYTATWPRPSGIGAKVIVTGLSDGGFLSRVVIDGPAVADRVDKAHLLAGTVDVEVVWDEIETIIRTINEAPMGWRPNDPIVVDYVDFTSLDVEVAAAEADAREAGLLASRQTH